MSRPLKISDEVYDMLYCLKPFPSTSFNDLILMLIEDVAPILPSEIRRIRKLKETDSASADSELDRLQKEVLQYYIVELLLRQKERREEALVEQYYEQQEIEERKGK